MGGKRAEYIPLGSHPAHCYCLLLANTLQLAPSDTASRIRSLVARSGALYFGTSYGPVKSFLETSIEPFGGLRLPALWPCGEIDRLTPAPVVG